MTRIKILLCTALSMIVVIMNPQAFLYPVALSNDKTGKEMIYVVHQISLYQLELWLWDPITTCATKALPSPCIPAGLRLLPEGNGFSCIDNGLIKIKKISENAVHIVHSDSLYEFGIVEWLDKENGYCSAKKRERFGIYHIAMNGSTQPLVHSIAFDCMYPCVVDSNLFYIERSESETGGFHYEVIQMPLRSKPDKDPFLVARQASQSLVNFGAQPIIFLRMLSASEGFVIGHPTHFDQHNSLLTFTCYHMQHTTQWQTTALFSFNIPSRLIFSATNDQLHESLIPLLPNSVGETIFFSHCYEGETAVNLYSFNKCTKLTQQLTFSNEQTVSFAAFPFKDFWYYGGTVTNALNAPSLVCDERGLVRITLPRLLV